MSHASCSWLARTPFPLPHRTPSLLDPPNGSIPAFRDKDFHSAVLRKRARSQVMSPTILSRSAVRGLRLCSCPREKHALVRLRTLARTSPLLLLCRKTKFGNAGLTTVNTGETSAAPSRLYHSHRENSESCTSHHPTRTERPVAMYSHKRKSGVFFNEKEKILPKHRKIREFHELRADHAKEKKQLYQDSLERNIMRDCYLRNKRNILSEARSELNIARIEGRMCRHGSP